MAQLGQVGELEIIRQLGTILKTGSDIITNIGDDCAVVRLDEQSNADIVLTSDAVIEGTHFNEGCEPHKIGHKAIGRVLSDLAAMGAAPRWAHINLVAPPQTDLEYIKNIYRGVQKLAGQHGLIVCGGDTACAAPLALHVFAAGTVEHGRAVTRNGAAQGQGIYVTGALGYSQQNGKHLDFHPRVAEGYWLRDYATAMLDISDGLAVDLKRMLQASGCGAILESSLIPVSEAAGIHDAIQEKLSHALYDGEDFELLFTIRQDKECSFLQEWHSKFDSPCRRIGITTAESGLLEWITPEKQREPLPHGGWLHYK